MKHPELSLCMIIRDEATMLPEFLASVAGLWDEFIAVDTGSCDDSRNLLEEAGAQVSSFSWIDDFAAARNASLDRATGRWILFLDADERVDPELKAAIRSLLVNDSAGAATVTLRNEMPGGHRRDSRLLRLFRNDSSIRFRYRIHEDISDGVQDFLKRTGLSLHDLPGRVDHLGYVREVAASRDKKERDLALLRLSLEQDPRDFYCRFKILEIARFWDDRETWQAEAAICAELLTELGPDEASGLKQRNWSGEMAAMVSQGLYSDSAQALAWLEKSVNWAGSSAAWWLRRAALQEELGQIDQAEECYRHCLTIPREAATQLVTVRPLLGLFRLYLRKGNLRKAAYLASQAADIAPLDPEAMLALATSSATEAGSRVIQDHLKLHPRSAVPLARAFIGTGQVSIARDILDQAQAEPEKDLGLLVCSLVLGEDFSGEINASQEEADNLLRSWVHCLWQSRNAQALGAFADNCVAITGAFPWLPGFLAEQTRGLSSSRR